MSVVSVHTTNRRALIVFICVLILSAGLGGGLLALQQRQIMKEHALREFDNDIDALGELAADALIRSDYASVERMLEHWSELHPEVILIKATTPSGFELAHFERPAGTTATVSRRKEVEFEGRRLVTFEFVKADTTLGVRITLLSFQFFAGAIIFVSLMGWLLWLTLQRTALRPLENEIRRREQIEFELRHRTLELETANKELDAFCYSISHDLRAPLRAIDGFSRVLAEDYRDKLDAVGQSHLQRVCTATQRLGVLIDDLLSLSRYALQELVPHDVDLSALAQQFVAQRRAAEPARQVTFNIAPNLHARGDRQLLSVVMQNLLANAWKFSSGKAPALIEFGTMERDNQQVFYVRDNGAGFDMQYAAKLFGAFQRMHKQTEFAGNGIGLALVQRILNRHGGSIRAEAVLGQGATFYFTLK
jgi:signal transduction histidine kinase